MSVHQCPECRREFEVLYPDLWAYKSGKGNNARFICSWCCLRRYEKRGVKEMKLSERDQKALDIALEGGNPIEFLKGFGIKNPGTAWYNIKLKVKHGDLETYRKLPAKITSKKPTAGAATDEAETPETPEMPTVKLDGPLKIETPEAHNVDIVETPERKIGGLCPPPEVEDDRLFHTAAVRSKKLGTFYYDDKHGTIDWRHPYGEEISLFPEDYRLLRDSIDMILQVLGVDA